MWESGTSADRYAVFLHHGLGSIESWKALPSRVSDLAPDVCCVAYERWGYGASEERGAFAPGFMEAEVPTLQEVLSELTPEPVDLIGHSDGGSIALLAAARSAGSVRSVVSIAAHTFVEPITTASIRSLMEIADRDGPQGWLTRFHGSRAGDLLREWGTLWLGQDHANWDIRDELPLIRCPVLAIQGDADEFGSDEQLWAVGNGVEGAETWLVPGVGHTPFVDEAAFARRIVDFWGKV